MATSLRKRASRGSSLGRRTSTGRSSQPIHHTKLRPGQHVSLSPVARLCTLPLPFDTTATNDASSQPTNAAALTDQASTVQASTTANVSTNDAGIQAQGLQAQRALVAQLSREVKRIEVAGRVQPDQLGRRSAIFSTGSAAIDGCLPSGGYESGTIIEYLQSSAGSGATTLALSAAREALVVTDRFCVVVDWRQQFYPPAAAALGLDLKRIVIVRPKTLADRLWAIDQALRSPAIVAVVAEVEQLDDRAARRLQLAAESGGGLGLLVRHSQRQHPSWAEVQWLVRPMRCVASHSQAPPIHMAHRQLQLELLRVRGGASGSRVNIQVNATNGRLEPATAALAKKLARA